MSAPLVATALAPAKLNIELRVLGRRADGFHEIDTTMVCVGPCDLVEARLVDRRVVGRAELAVRLAVHGPAATADVLDAPQNLVERAARAYVDTLAGRVDLKVDFDLELGLFKSIPSRAGLGGASSDAAAALLAVRDLVVVRTGHALPWVECLERLAELGSDTVFFAASRFTGRGRATGRGEHVEVLSPTLSEREREWFALVVPDVGCATPGVYSAFAATPRRADSSGPVNDLADAARAVEPILDDWFEALGPRFSLSGSGSSLFASTADAGEATSLVEHARTVAARLGRAPRWCGVTRARRHGVRLVRAPRGGTVEEQS